MNQYGKTLRWSLALVALVAGSAPAADGFKPGEPAKRAGDEIVVCGQLFHTGTPVVLWTDPGGYDAYRVERRFAPYADAGWAATEKAGALKNPARFGLRAARLTPAEIDKVRGGGWPLELLQDKVDQFVVHFDACGLSQTCFKVLHDQRGLSVHFMLDLDGTIYQTLDLKEAAWHATIANSRSIGIEIANMGAYSAREPSPLERWYKKDKDGQVRIVPPNGWESSGIKIKGLDLRPDRNEPIVGNIQKQNLTQYDLTPQQYASLTKLTATLCTVFPKIRCDYPKDPQGKLLTVKIPDAEYRNYQGVLGHYHVQTNKVDPGPAFQWDRVIGGAKELMTK